MLRLAARKLTVCGTKALWVILITLRRVCRGRGLPYTAVLRFHQGRGEAVRSKRAKDELSNSSRDCVPTTLSDSEGYPDDQQWQHRRFYHLWDVAK